MWVLTDNVEKKFRKNLENSLIYGVFHSVRNKMENCQAQFQLASSVQVQLRTEISLIITVRPPHPPTPPGQVSSSSPRKLKFGMQANFTNIR